MGNWLPTILAALTAAVVAVSPELQHLLANHPVLTAVLSAVSVIVAHLMPSPMTPD